MNYADITNTNHETIDTKIAERLVFKIVVMERENLKSREYNSSQMVDKIITAIEEELKCF